MNVVLIPAYSRAEFLTIALEQIVKNPDFKENFYLLSFDHGGRRDNIAVFNKWLREHHLQGKVTERELKYRGLMKQSWNVIAGYREAITITDDLIYMIEDDIMISPQFFQWHKAVHAKHDLFASVGTCSIRSPFKSVKDLSKYYITQDYQSLGVCFNKKQLQWVLELFTDEYFENPRRAIKRLFGVNPPVNLNFVEQDAMFHNVIKYNKLKIAFPVYGFAFHAGFVGKSRGQKVVGSLPEKVAKVREIIFDEQKMKQTILKSGQPIGFFEDSKPIDLTLEWNGHLNEKPL